jgi:hypothetical protein
MATEQKYYATCNGVRYTGPLTLAEAQRYVEMRRHDRKNPRLTGERKDHPDNLTFGAKQNWDVVPA